MSTTFVPPKPEQWEGPGQKFVPPPIDSWQGGPSFPKGKGTGDLPEMTNEDIKSFGRKALDYAPAVGATIGTILAPEGALPAIGAAMLGGGLGSATKQAVLKGTHSPDAPQGIKESALEIGKDVLEQGAYEAGGRLVSKPIQWLASKVTPTRLYQSALRPGLSKKNLPKIDTEVATGLREGIPVSRAGADIASARLEKLNEEIAEKIQSKSDELGAVINPLDVTKPVNRLKPTFANQVNPEADLKAINSAKSEFLQKHSVPFTGPLPEQHIQNPMFGDIPTGEPIARPSVKQPLTLVEAQSEKQGTYRQLRGKYGELSAANTEAQKQLARGLKDEIVKAFPEINALNARDSALIDLEGQLLRFAGRHGNTNIMGIGTPIVAGAAGAMAGAALPAIGAGILKSAIDNPEIKSKIAIALYKASRGIVGDVTKAVAPHLLSGAARVAGASVDANQPINTKRAGFGQMSEDTIASRLSQSILGGQQ